MSKVIGESGKYVLIRFFVRADATRKETLWAQLSSEFDYLENGYIDSEDWFKIFFLRMASIVDWLKNPDDFLKRWKKEYLESLTRFGEVVLHPFCVYLGRVDITTDLEDAIVANHPVYYTIKEKVKILKSRESFSNIKAKISEELNYRRKDSVNLPAISEITFEHRVKGPISRIKKLQEEGEVVDRYGIRIIVHRDDKEKCYTLMNLCLRIWRPASGSIAVDDYIRYPKKNGYSELKTVLEGEGRTPFELQIRTFGMHFQNKIGGASHAGYKRGKEEELWKTEETDTEEEKMVMHLRYRVWNRAFSLFSRRKVVFDNSGKLYSLPLNASIADLSIIRWKEIKNGASIEQAVSGALSRRGYNNPILPGEIITWEKETSTLDINQLEVLNTSYGRMWLIANSLHAESHIDVLKKKLRLFGERTVKESTDLYNLPTFDAMVEYVGARNMLQDLKNKKTLLVLCPRNKVY